MAQRLEHANINAHDMEAIVAFLQTAFPDFQVRGKGIGVQGNRWLHVGTDDTYIALMQAKPGTDRPGPPYTGIPGVNHLAYEVDDANALRSRMIEAGYQESTPPNAHPHRTRIYFYDPEGNDWEFVQYHSDDPAERNDYDTPDS